jgi:hypothetical protein
VKPNHRIRLKHVEYWSVGVMVKMKARLVVFQYPLLQYSITALLILNYFLYNVGAILRMMFRNMIG